VAALGVNKPFAYTGEVARIVVGRRRKLGRPQDRDLRDVNNGRDEVALPAVAAKRRTSGDDVVTAEPSEPVQPDDGDPYDVATAGHVEIAIYDVTGLWCGRW